MATYELLVSAENNCYMAWQAMLFHYSCVTHVGQAPLIIVHAGDEPLLPEFGLIERRGGRVRRAPNLRWNNGIDYAPRNLAGTLSYVESEADYLVLCEPDMVFFRPAAHLTPRLAADQIGLEAVAYLSVDDTNRRTLAHACDLAGLDFAELERAPISGGMPVVLRRSLQEPLSREWFHCLEFFEQIHEAETEDSHPEEFNWWIRIMWALVFAVRRLGLRHVISNYCVVNYPGTELPLGPSSSQTVIVHYGYSDDVFDKRLYFGDQAACNKVWAVRPQAGNVSGLVCAAIGAAREFYGISADA